MGGVRGWMMMTPSTVFVIREDEDDDRLISWFSKRENESDEMKENVLYWFR